MQDIVSGLVNINDFRKKTGTESLCQPKTFDVLAARIFTGTDQIEIQAQQEPATMELACIGL